MSPVGRRRPRSRCPPALPPPPPPPPLPPLRSARGANGNGSTGWRRTPTMPCAPPASHPSLPAWPLPSPLTAAVGGAGGSPSPHGAPGPGTGGIVRLWQRYEVSRFAGTGPRLPAPSGERGPPAPVAAGCHAGDRLVCVGLGLGTASSTAAPSRAIVYKRVGS